jgi:hypothetical protein
MKNKILLLSLLIPLNIFSQNGDDYKLTFKSNKNYITDYESYTVMRTSLEGDKSLIDNLNRASLYPMEITILQNVSISLLAGSDPFDGMTPIKIKITKAQEKGTFNQKVTTKKSPLVGSVYDGVLLGSNIIIPKPESINNLNSSEINELRNYFEIASNSRKFPESFLSNGFQFSQKKLISIPIEGLKPITCSVEYIYTLTDTNDNIAHFKIDQIVTEDSLENDSSVVLSGNGNGEMDYDINNEFYINQTLNTFISIRFKSEMLDVITTYINSIKRLTKIK